MLGHHLGWQSRPSRPALPWACSEADAATGAARGAVWAQRAGGGSAAIERQDPRLLGAGMQARAHRGEWGNASAARAGSAGRLYVQDQGMLACLRGQRNLTALAFHFSPLVAR